MNDDGNFAYAGTRLAEGSEPAAWRPGWATAGPCLDVESEIEVRFAVLAARYGEMLCRFLQALTRRQEVAEDLSQQLWLKLLEAARAGRFLPDDDAALRSYLFAAARNLFLDECVRKHGSSRTTTCDHTTLEALLGSHASQNGAPQETEYAQDQSGEAIRRAISDLPPLQRQVIRLWMNGTSIDAMVASTGACRDTVLSRKKYALRRLKAGLARFSP